MEALLKKRKELEYKQPEPVVKVDKGKGMKTKRPVVVNEVAVTVEDAPDIFESSFDSDSDVYSDDRTDAEREDDDAWCRKNEEQIPEEVKNYYERECYGDRVVSVKMQHHTYE